MSAPMECPPSVPRKGMGYLISAIAILVACTTAGSGGAPTMGGNVFTGGYSNTGGAPATGGASTGGVTNPGGAGSGGNPSTSGIPTGGTTTGVSATGGIRTGGSATGGMATGGAATGGAAPGGTTTGGIATGGVRTGGTTNTGGITNTDGGVYKPCPTDGTPCKIMPFGDSITDGYSSTTPGGYRVELFRLAHSASKSITFVGSGSNGPDTVDGVTFPHNHEGHSGWTIDTVGGRTGISTLLKNNGSSVLVKYTPHIILLMIGTNDAIDNYDMANAPARLGKLIDTIYAQLPNVLIVVAKPVPSRGSAAQGDDMALSDRLKVYGDALPAMVKAKADTGKHILLVDMFTPFNPKKGSLMVDEWHPNLQGYLVIGTEWYSVLKSLL